MDPLLRDKLLDLLVNIISIVLGGGLVSVFIEWRRHQREKLQWEREDKFLEIDVPRAEILVRRWTISDDMNDKEKLMVYEHKLEGTIRELIAVATFVIRNTTNAEVVLTSFDAELVQGPPTGYAKRFYDLETNNLVTIGEVDAIKLQPHAAITRQVIITGEYGPDYRLEEAPSTIDIQAVLSNGTTVHGRAPLNLTNRLIGVSRHKGVVHPKKYAEKLLASEEFDDDIPF